MSTFLGAVNIEPGRAITVTINPEMEATPQEEVANLAPIFEDAISHAGESYTAMRAYLATHYPGVRLSIGDLARYIQAREA